MIYTRKHKRLFWDVLKACAFLLLCYIFILPGAPDESVNKLPRGQGRSKFKAFGVPKSHPQHCVQSKRQRLLRHACSPVNAPKMPAVVRPDLYPYARMLVDKEHEVIYCGMPKVATTTFMGLLIKSSSQYKNDPHLQQLLDKDPDKSHSPVLQHRVGIKKLSEYDAIERERMIASYTKVLVVRHPMERVLSAYLDKMVRENNTEYKGKQLLVAMSYGDAKDKQDTKVVVSFKAFAKMLTHKTDGMSKNNEHWMEYINLCQPCKITYDHIIKLETVQNDIAFLLSKLSLTANNSGVFFNTRQNVSVKKKNRLKMYRSLDPAYVTLIEERYEMDMKMFGYTWNNSHTPGVVADNCKLK